MNKIVVIRVLARKPLAELLHLVGIPFSVVVLGLIVYYIDIGEVLE